MKYHIARIAKTIESRSDATMGTSTIKQLRPHSEQWIDNFRESVLNQYQQVSLMFGPFFAEHIAE